MRDNIITYHNEVTHMLLTQDSLPIVWAKKDQNLFVLDVATPKKIIETNAMMTTEQGMLIHLVSYNKKV